jgi:hypothetical protein
MCRKEVFTLPHDSEQRHQPQYIENETPQSVQIKEPVQSPRSPKTSNSLHMAEDSPDKLDDIRIFRRILDIPDSFSSLARKPFYQVAAEKAKASRKPIIHLLATGPMTKVALREALSGVSDNDFEQAFERVANPKFKKWELTEKYWRELDVWTYDYPEAEDRQCAIDNAVSMFDKLRLGVTEPEWDRLYLRHNGAKESV